MTFKDLGLKDSIQATFPKKKVYAVGLGAAKFRYLGNVDKFDESFYDNSLLIVLKPHFSSLF